MLDVKAIRSDPATIRANLARRKDEKLLQKFDEFIQKDKDTRNLRQELDHHRAIKNKLSAKFRGTIPAGTILTNEETNALTLLSVEENSIEQEEIDTKELLMSLPNLLHPFVPEGKDATENKEVFQWGTPSTKDTIAHGVIAEKLGFVDFERAAKVSGAGFAYIKGDLARLDLALQLFALDMLEQRGFTPIEVPLLMRREYYNGVTALEDFENVMYRVGDEITGDEYWTAKQWRDARNNEQFLIATSEHPIAAMYANEVIEKVPIKLAGISPCFRQEIGSSGVDTKGIFRMHQFNKVEQFVFCQPEESEDIHIKLLENAMEIFKALEITHRVVDVCTGDIGTVAARKYDVEAWSPRQKKWIEVVSCSNCTDYQARRLNIKVGKHGGEKKFVHTLNSTAVATSRAMVAILENNQTDDGNVRIPSVLKQYMGNRDVLRPLEVMK